MLVRLRSRLTWSRSMRAAFLGGSRDVVRRWETGERNPSGAARRLIWLLHLLVTDRNKLQNAMDLIFWGRGEEARAYTRLGGGWPDAGADASAAPF